MRDFNQALAGVEVQDMNLDNLGLSSRTRRRIYKFLDEIIVRDYSQEYQAINSLELSTEAREAEIENLIQWREGSRRDVDWVLRVFFPNIDKSAPNSLTIWPVVDARSKGRSARAGMKIGRALRRMFPVLTDTEVDNLVDIVKSKLIAKEYTHCIGKDGGSFRKAYTWVRAADENLDTTWSKKHMCNSCMRYEFEQYPVHPVEAYASGDFESHWIETSDGKIAARSVVCVSKAGAHIKPMPAPIYAVSEDAYEFLHDKLMAYGCVPIAESNWVGAMLVANYVNEIDIQDGIYAPYLDLDPRGATDVGDNKVMISRKGDIDCSNYGGILYEGDRYCCHDCGEGVSDDDRYTHPQGHDDSTYCHDCYYERYMNCENCCEDDARENASEVHSCSRYSQYWCQDCVDAHAVETMQGELWSDEYVRYTHCGNYISDPEFENNWFVCDLTEEIYPNEQLQTLTSGGIASIDAIEDHNAFFDLKYRLDNKSGTWTLDDDTADNLEGEKQSA